MTPREPENRRITDAEEMKAIMKDALKEWLDEKLMQFGRWSLTGIGCMALVVLTYMALKFAGWNPPNGGGN